MTYTSQNEHLEARFDISEMFVSFTDKRGIILSGNDVFVRVSGYTRDRLIGSPHNIIRHKDMPKSVFRLFWDTISASKPICAYVKNKSIDGRYYWVLAIVFPTSSGYFSVRIKPTSEILDTVQKIYQEARQAETQSVEAGLQLLLKKLNELGFKDYEEFTLHALSTELKSRDTKLADTQEAIRFGNSLDQKFLKKMSETFNDASGMAALSAEKMADFSKATQFFNECTKTIEQMSEGLEFLTVNMSIAAHRLGKEGAALSVVAAHFQDSSRQFIAGVNEFQNRQKKVALALNQEVLKVLMSRVLTEMLSFLVVESVNQASTKELNDKLKDARLILQIVKNEFAKNLDSQRQLLRDLALAFQEIQKVDKMVTKLDLIRTGGRLEGSRTVESVRGFIPFVKDMSVFVQKIGDPIEKMISSLGDLQNALERVVLDGSRILSNLEELLKIDKWTTVDDESDHDSMKTDSGGKSQMVAS